MSGGMSKECRGEMPEGIVPDPWMQGCKSMVNYSEERQGDMGEET